MNSLIQHLNEPQREAVTTTEGPVLVLAGAGSGKTRVVTFRIAHLLENGVGEERILGVTFTNKAAAEMRERVHHLTKSHVLICTFHSLGARMLRESIHFLGYQRNFTIYDEEDTDKILKSCLEELNIKGKQFEPKVFRQMISQAKNSMVGPEEAAEQKAVTEVEEKFPAVYEAYRNKLFQCNALDFDDLLYLPVILLRDYPEAREAYQHRWQYVHIDEYQDTNTSQYMLAKILVEHNRNIFVVGDPDQSIYSWRGANIQNILNFERDYPGTKIIRLEENYRSHTNILNAANAVIQHNEERLEKNLWSNLGPGDKIKYYKADSERDEANFISERVRFHHEEQHIPLSEIVVFYRTHAQSRPFEDYFVSHRIPYVIVGGVSFYQRREVKDILAFMRIVNSSADLVSFIRTLNLPKRGLGDSTIEKLSAAADQEKKTIFAYLADLAEGVAQNHPVKLSSKQMQGVKDYVHLIKELKAIAHTQGVTALVKASIDLSNYIEFLKNDQETYEERLENVNALITKASEWEIEAIDPTLSAFLEELSLKSNLDETGKDRERVSLMTIHNGKGLEFKVTFLGGMEEDLFPHINSRDSRQQLEEERRLCYVAMTRAKDQLYVTTCMQRYIWGIMRTQRPSRFIREIPAVYMESVRRFSGNRMVGFKQDLAREEPVRFIDEIDQRVPDYDQVSEHAFAVGDAVFHKDFGVGVIRSLAEGSMGLTYKVHFSKDNRERSLVASLAKLKKL